MLRRSIFVLLFAILLATASISASLAQAQFQVTPDAGVRGSGFIRAHETNHGFFYINVARSGDLLYGGFRYVEVTPQGVRVATIVSQVIVGLHINGNTAAIEAVGHWDGVRSHMLIEVLDDNPSGDWFHIVARQRITPPREPYDQAGGVVRGDIVVYTNPPPDAVAKGMGTIAVGENRGGFNFASAKYGDVVVGQLHYMEYYPTSTGGIARPKVSIGIPVIQRLHVTGNVATLGGNGFINGHPAMVEVTAIDNSMLATPVPVADEFYIKATPIPTSSEPPPPDYTAGGPLTSGDIFVRSK